jgi:flagellar basal-body rod protein FlgB
LLLKRNQQDMHIMTTLSPLDNLLQFHQNALNLRAFRQQLLAANIANADTPGYKARDIDFAAALRDISAGRGVTLSTSNEKHLGGATRDEPTAALYRGVQQPSIDGNTVDMDMERNRFADNAVHYDANLTFLNSQIKLMLAALQG